MNKPVRIQLSRKKGWRMPPNTVNVARPSRWGNPWVVWRDNDGQWRVSNVPEHRKVASKEAGILLAVKLHEEWWRGQLDIFGTATMLSQLHGKNLACWCRLCAKHANGKPLGVECPDCAPCHSDILLAVSNYGE